MVSWVCILGATFIYLSIHLNRHGQITLGEGWFLCVTECTRFICTLLSFPHSVMNVWKILSCQDTYICLLSHGCVVLMIWPYCIFFSNSLMDGCKIVPNFLYYTRYCSVHSCVYVLVQMFSFLIVSSLKSRYRFSFLSKTARRTLWPSIYFLSNLGKVI